MTRLWLSAEVSAQAHFASAQRVPTRRRLSLLECCFSVRQRPTQEQLQGTHSMWMLALHHQGADG